MSLSAAALFLSLVTETNAFLRLLWSSLLGCVGEGANAISQEPATSLPFLMTGRKVCRICSRDSPHGTGGSSVWDPTPPPPEDLFLLLFSRSMYVGGTWFVGLTSCHLPPSSTDTGRPSAASLQAQGQGNDGCPVEFLWQEGSGKFSVDLASTLWAPMLCFCPFLILSWPFRPCLTSPRFI